MKIKSNWVQCGSRKWGGWTDDSDYDYIVYIDDIKDILKEDEIEEQEYSERHSLKNDFHFYHTDDGASYNFIVYKDYTTFLIAKKAIEGITLISTTPLGRWMSLDKHYRIEIVEDTFRNAFKHYKEHPMAMSISRIYSGIPQQQVPYAYGRIEHPKQRIKLTNSGTVFPTGGFAAAVEIPTAMAAPDMVGGFDL